MTAVRFYEDKLGVLNQLQGVLKTNDLLKSVSQLVEENQALNKKINQGVLKKVAQGSSTHKIQLEMAYHTDSVAVLNLTITQPIRIPLNTRAEGMKTCDELGLPC
ncbi:hypothetical protein N9Y89_01820 [bacterium]|nr:hypothetical protein [bacterium]